MPIWERYSGGVQFITQGSHYNEQVFHNQEDTDNFQSADVIIVDGILTVNTDSDDLMGIRLLVVPELLVDGDLTEDAPAPHDRMVYYSWYAARGPLVFRLRSKKTIPPENKLWVQTWKAGGSATTQIRWGLHAFMHLKH